MTLWKKGKYNIASDFFRVQQRDEYIHIDIEQATFDKELGFCNMYDCWLKSWLSIYNELAMQDVYSYIF